VADGIDVPIKLPTESSSVRAAAGVVKALEAQIAALGPAAAASSSQAQASMRALGAAADAAKKQVAAAKAIDAVRGTRASGPVRPEEAKARANAEAAAGRAAVKAIDDERKAADAAEKGRIKARATAEKASAKAAAAEIKAKAKAEEKASKDAEKAAKAAARAKASSDKKAASDAKKAAAESKKESDKAKKGNEALAKSADDAVGKVGMAVAGAMVAIAAMGAVIVASFSVALVKVQAFKESTVNAFTKLLGSSAAAKKAFDQTIAAADEIGVSYKDALSGVNSLVAKGFGADQAIQLVKAMADLKSVVPDANISNLLLAISQIKSKGVLQMEELQGQIAEAGLSVSVVLEEIGKKIGKSAAEVRAMIGQGKISADQGVQGILAAIQKTTGKPIGEAAKEAANSLQGLLARVEQLPEGLLMSADAGKGLGVIKDVLKNVLAAFSPATAGGKALAAALGKLGDAVASMFSGLTGKGGAEKLASFAAGAAVAIERVAQAIAGIGSVIGPVLGGLVGGLGDGMKAGDKFFGAVNATTGGAEKLAPTLEKVGAAVGFVVGALISAVNVIAQVNASIDKLGNFIEKIGGVETILGGVSAVIQAFAMQVAVEAVTIGANLVQGIVQGMAGGLPGLLGAVAGVVGATTGAAKAGFGTHSPSVIWRDEIGYQLPAGGAEGIENGASMMRRSASKLAANTNASAASAIGATGGAKQGPSIGELHFHGMTRADADFYETRTRALWAELAAA